MDKRTRSSIYHKKYMFSKKEYGTKPIHSSETIRELKRIVGNKKIKDYLDIGCGSCFYSNLFPEAHYVGIDIVDKQIERAKKKKLDVKKHDLEEPFPFKDNSFDCIFAMDILEHIYNTSQCLREINRVLKPDGILILQVPNISSLSSRIKVLMG